MNATSPSRSSRPGWIDTLAILLVALALTGINAGKPLVVDDTLYFEYAQHIRAAPSDPYGFETIWLDRVQPANELMVPHVLPYYLALSMAAFGENPLTLKLSLFPFALLLGYAMWWLLNRFAPRDRIPLLFLAVLSPVVMPAFNLMLDVPMLALSLAALAVLIQAGDGSDRNTAWALAGGIVGGLAMLTKYNAVGAFVAGLFYLVLAGHWARALVAGVGASMVFLGWETFVFSRYGASHFFNSLVVVGSLPRGSAAQWLFSFASLAGAALPALGLLAAAALRAPRVLLTVMATGIVLMFFVIAVGPPLAVGSMGYFFPEWKGLQPTDWLVFATGLVVCLAAGAVLMGRIKPLAAELSGAGFVRSMQDPGLRADAFVLVWVLLALIAFFVLSPFPALRRLIPLYIALVCALGRALTRMREGRGTGFAQVRVVSVFGVAVGLLFAVTDFTDAAARREGVSRLSERISEIRSDSAVGSAWFTGHWGFRYYAGQEGLRMAIPEQSTLKAGDLLVIPRGVHRPRLYGAANTLELLDIVQASSSWPWSTLPGAYAGYRPLRPQPDSQIRMEIYRVLSDMVPRGR